MTVPANITVARPHVPTGPKNVPTLVSDADYLRAAVKNIRHANERRQGLWGSGVTEMVVRLLLDAADALDALACPKCGEPTEAFTHTAPGFGGLEGVHCPACGWEQEQ